MRSSLTRQVLLVAVGGLSLALLVTGLITGALIHWRATQSLDAALLAAAAHAPAPGEVWTAGHVESPVSARRVNPDDPALGPGWAEAALSTEQAQVHDVGDRRLLLLAVEEPHPPSRASENKHPHALVLAEGPRVHWTQSVLPFGLLYGLASVCVALGGGAVLTRRLRRALSPIHQLAAALDALSRPNARLPDVGPEELSVVSQAVNDLLLRLQESDAAQARFIAAAAHELRSPITALSGELELALRRPRPAEELRDALLRAKETTDELRSLVESLLGLARVDAGQVELSRQVERASALAQRALRSEAAALDAAGCGVTLTLAADPELSVNGALVEVALSNLLRNAARYAPGAPVTVCVQADGDGARFVVDDEGPGLTPAELERAFERFVRLGDRATPGAGLGLALARGIARRHGGDVWLEARPGGGLRAVLRLGR